MDEDLQREMKGVFAEAMEDTALDNIAPFTRLATRLRMILVEGGYSTEGAEVLASGLVETAFSATLMVHPDGDDDGT